MKLGAGTRSEGEVRYIMKAENGNKGLDAGRIVAVRGNNRQLEKEEVKGGMCVMVCVCMCACVIVAVSQV